MKESGLLPEEMKWEDAPKKPAQPAFWEDVERKIRKRYDLAAWLLGLVVFMMIGVVIVAATKSVVALIFFGGPTILGLLAILWAHRQRRRAIEQTHESHDFAAEEAYPALEEAYELARAEFEHELKTIGGQAQARRIPGKLTGRLHLRTDGGMQLHYKFSWQNNQLRLAGAEGILTYMFAYLLAPNGQAFYLNNGRPVKIELRKSPDTLDYLQFPDTHMTLPDNYNLAARVFGTRIILYIGVNNITIPTNLKAAP